MSNLTYSRWVREVCRGCSRGLNVGRGPNLVYVSGSALPGLHSTFYTGEVLIQAGSAACDSDALVVGIIEAAMTSSVQTYLSSSNGVLLQSVLIAVRDLQDLTVRGCRGLRRDATVKILSIKT
jgi:hypothetical protein